MKRIKQFGLSERAIEATMREVKETHSYDIDFETTAQAIIKQNNRQDPDQIYPLDPIPYFVRKAYRRVARR
jgi:hypothetical protein